MQRAAVNRVKHHVTCPFVLSVNGTTLRLRTVRRTALDSLSAHAWRQTLPRVRTRVPFRQPATYSVNWPGVRSTSAVCRRPKLTESWPSVTSERSCSVTAPISDFSSL